MPTPTTPAATRNFCLITPTHRRDLEQFALLRRSVNRFMPGVPHLVIVNREDCAIFERRFAAERDLVLIRSSDILPASIEWRRRRSGPKWLTGLRRVSGGLVKGWHAQQLMKLFLLAECPYEAAAFVDSDVFVCRPLPRDYFHVGERLKLFRRVAPNAEAMDFDIATHEILGNPLHRISQLSDYIYSPTCFRRSTAEALFAEFRRRRRSGWVRRFLSQKRPSEYHLLGYAATELERGAGYHPVECDPEDVHHSIRYPEDEARLAADIERMVAEPRDFALIQSRLGVAHAHIERAYERIVAAYGSPVTTFSTAAA